MRIHPGTVLAGLGLVVLACSGSTIGGFPGSDAGASDARGASDAPVSCPPGLRVFNGECRAICTGGGKCPSGDACIAVDDQSLCLPYANCAYLGDDTQCVASGGLYQYSGRGGFATFVPYLSTPGADPNDTLGFDDPYFYGGGQAGPCAGDAKWITKPVQGPVGCKAKHTVSRCRLFYDRCELVSGTTHEFVQP